MTPLLVEGWGHEAVNQNLCSPGATKKQPPVANPNNPARWPINLKVKISWDKASIRIVNCLAKGYSKTRIIHEEGILFSSMSGMAASSQTIPKITPAFANSRHTLPLIPGLASSKSASIHSRGPCLTMLSAPWCCDKCAEAAECEGTWQYPGRRTLEVSQKPDQPMDIDDGSPKRFKTHWIFMWTHGFNMSNLTPFSFLLSAQPWFSLSVPKIPKPCLHLKSLQKQVQTRV